MKHTVRVIRTQSILIEVMTDSEKYAHDLAKYTATNDGENLSWDTTVISADVEGKSSE